MHNRFDQFVKQLARNGLSPGGLVETDAEVSPDAQRIDVWFVPDVRHAHRVLSGLGLLGRMARRACTLEPFHRTPSGERRLALPILVRLRLEIPTDPAKQPMSDREFLMSTQDIDKYLQQLEEKGRKEGREEGFAQAVLAAYRARFGAPPASLVAAVQRAKDQAALQRWLELVTTRTEEEVGVQVRRARGTAPGAPCGDEPPRRFPATRDVR